MAEKIARLVVKQRRIILVMMLIVMALSIITIGRTRINYDFTKYLSESTMTRRSLDIMNAEFASSEQIRVLLCDCGQDGAENAAAKLQELEEVYFASFSPDSDVRERDGHTYYLLTATLSDGVDGSAVISAVNGTLADYGEVELSGSVVQMNKIKSSLAGEIPIALVVSVLIVLAVLLLTSGAWIEPFLILTVLAIGIVINMGTNWVFESISFVTFAVCAILQLALSMDYAIMLIHAYREKKAMGLNDEEAMVEALLAMFMPVASSAFTTMAGLLSLLFMSFTIGFDIGMVLSKGILISMLVVFLVMPAMILSCANLIRKTEHKALSLGGHHIANLTYKARKPGAILLVLVILASAYFQTQNTYVFTEQGSLLTHSQIKEIYGESNTLVLLVPVGKEDEDYAWQKAVVDAVNALTVNGKPVVKSVSAYVTTGAQALAYYTAADISEMLGMNQFLVSSFLQINGLSTEGVRADKLLKLASGLVPDNDTVKELAGQIDMLESTFNGPEHARIICALDLPLAGADTYSILDQVSAILQGEYGTDYGMTGTSMSSYDISNAFRSDLLLVNGLTILAIFVILLISFRKVVIPVILICVIQGAIWITMAFSYAVSQPIFFISYLICVAIQMGATIDYAILLTNNYRAERAGTGDNLEALKIAMHKTLPTIATSGSILVLAGYTVGKVCTVYYISSIGLLLARGAAISVCLVLILLPMLLIIFDRFVHST